MPAPEEPGEPQLLLRAMITRSETDRTSWEHIKRAEYGRKADATKDLDNDSVCKVIDRTGKQWGSK